MRRVGVLTESAPSVHACMDYSVRRDLGGLPEESQGNATANPIKI
jgi:hypothetical protein